MATKEYKVGTENGEATFLLDADHVERLRKADVEVVEVKAAPAPANKARGADGK